MRMYKIMNEKNGRSISFLRPIKRQSEAKLISFQTIAFFSFVRPSEKVNLDRSYFRLLFLFCDSLYIFNITIYTLSFSIFRHLRIQHLRIVMTSRRQTFPCRVFTPTQHTPPSTHYLLLFEETNSYQIVAQSSLKNINDDVTFILIRNKLLQAKIVFHGLLSYLFICFILANCLSGSLGDCNSEYARLTRLSQDQADDQNNRIFSLHVSN